MKLKYVVPAVALLALSLSACSPKNVDSKTGCSTLAVTAADLATPEQKTAYTYGVLLGSMPVTLSAVGGVAGKIEPGFSEGIEIAKMMFKGIAPGEAFDGYVAQSSSAVPYKLPLDIEKMSSDEGFDEVFKLFTHLMNGRSVGALVYQAQKNSEHAIALQTPEKDKCFLMAGYNAASLASPDSASMLAGDLTKYLMKVMPEDMHEDEQENMLKSIQEAQEEEAPVSAQ